MLTQGGLAFVEREDIMFNTSRNGQTIGGSADLAGMSKDELIKLWNETSRILSGINPMEDYESYAYYRVLFDNIVKTYYKDFNGCITIDEEN